MASIAQPPQQAQEPDDLQILSERYFDLIWKDYMFQVSCITREDYERMQQVIPGYIDESYEEHMSRLTQGIPHEVSVMVKQIRAFLEKYVEFQDSRYAEAIEQMGEKIRSDKEKYKLRALELLKEGAVEGEGGRRGESLSQHPPLFETFVGPAHFVLPTYGNPLMTCFYSLLFPLFSIFQSQDVDQSIPSGQ
jgi:hypothetical protein